jgi:hypothetical protein
MPTPTRNELVGQHRALTAQVQRHKVAIGWNRKRLHEAKAALAALEVECRRFGIKLIVPSTRGEGDIHGPDTAPSAPSIEQPGPRPVGLHRR